MRCFERGDWRGEVVVGPPLDKTTSLHYLATTMRNYSREEIDALIHCAKKIIEPYKYALRLTGGDYRGAFQLQSVETGERFEAFIRKNAAFEENFSIGLVHVPRDDREKLTLLRCNGPHGEYLDSSHDMGSSPDPVTHHNLYHLHTATAESIAAGRKPEYGGQPTSEYAVYEEALRFFLREINVSNSGRFFQQISQAEIAFDNMEEV